MTIEELVGKRVELTKSFTCNLNRFKTGTRMRVTRIYGNSEGLVLVDRMRPDISLVIGPGELRYLHVLREDAHCFFCNKEVKSKDGRTCPDCGKVLFELVARQPE